MRCVVATLLLFTSIQVVLGQSQSSPTKRDESHTKDTKKAEPKPPVSNTVVVTKQETTSAQNDGAKIEPKSYLGRLFTPENLPNVVLCFVGIGGIIVAICTLKIIQRQTEHVARQAQSMRYQTTHLKNSVEVAKTSADAAVAAERAWVMVDIEKNPGEGFIMDGSETKEGKIVHTTGAYLCCVYRNAGKTPARIIETRIGLLAGIRPLPIEPDFNIDVFDRAPCYMQSGEVCKKSGWVHGEGRGGIGNMIVIYGTVRYTHIFSDKEVHTTFSYRVTPSYELERLTDYPKYNEIT